MSLQHFVSYSDIDAVQHWLFPTIILRSIVKKVISFRYWKISMNTKYVCAATKQCKMWTKKYELDFKAEKMNKAMNASLHRYSKW